jgi:hypothetical protein
MMRVLVLALVAGNLLYFGWSRWINEEQPRLVAPASTVAVQSKPPASMPAVCTTVGPVRDETRALELEATLRDLRFTPSRRTATEPVHEGWWVFVNAADEEEQARTLRRIQAAGIRDAFAMPTDAQHRVSVGIFREESGAASRAEVVRALRLDALVEERMQPLPVTWFDLPGTAAGLVDLARLARDVEPIESLRVEACPAEVIAPLDANEADPGPQPPQV